MMNNLANMHQMYTANAPFSAGGFLGTVHPMLGFVIFAPEPILDSSRFLRIHNQIMRNVMRAVLLTHHQKRIPGHFIPDARSKYQYKPRTEATHRIKQAKYHHDTDLVQGGKTMRHMTQSFPHVLIRGDSSKVLTGTVRYRFPFPVSRDAKDPRHVSMAVMGQEVAKMTDAEKQEVVKQFAELYAADLKYEMASRPKMKAAAIEAGHTF